jgi:hypothetical protein
LAGLPDQYRKSKTVETPPFKPAMMSLGEVDRQVDMSTQRLKARLLEASDRTQVARHRPDRQVLIAASGGFCDYLFDEKSSNASAAESITYHDRFDLPPGPAVEKTRQADNPTMQICHQDAIRSRAAR